MKRVVSSGLRFTVPARSPMRGSGVPGDAEPLSALPPDGAGDSGLPEPDDAQEAAYHAAPASASTYSGVALQREPLVRCDDSGFTIWDSVEVETGVFIAALVAVRSQHLLHAFDLGHLIGPDIRREFEND